MVPIRFADPPDELDWIFENMSQRMRGGIMPRDVKDDNCVLGFDLAGAAPRDEQHTIDVDPDPFGGR